MQHLNHLHIWRDANRLLLTIEQAVRQFPRYHKYSLGTDMRRQAMTVCRLILRAPAVGMAQSRDVGSVEESRGKTMVRRIFVLSVATLLAVCCGLAQAAQVCRDDIAATAPDSRYQDNGDGTVTDLATGLIWKQCAEGLSGPGCATGAPQSFTWQAALQHAEAAVFVGNSLWRLPNKNELASLVERRCYGPAINATFFPNTPVWFWSSSPNANYSSYAWFVYFNDGSVSYLVKNYQGYVRLVRAGQ